MLSTFKEVNKILISSTVNDKECYPDSNMKTTIIANMLIHIDDKKLKEMFNKDKLDYITNNICKCDHDKIKDICKLDDNSIMKVLLMPLYDYIIIVDDTIGITKLHLIKEIVKTLNNLYTATSREGISLISFLYTDIYAFGDDITDMNNVLDNIVPHDHNDDELKKTDLEKTIDFFLHLMTDDDLAKPVRILYLTDDTGLFLNEIGQSKCSVMKERSVYGENVLSFQTVDVDKIVDFTELINFI
jgi:hypothetical protein